MALKKNDKLIKTLLSTLKEAVIILAPDGIVLNFNSKVTKRLGVRLKQGCHIRELLDKPEYSQLLKRLFRVTGREKFRYSIKGVNYSFRVSKDENFIIVSLINVTEKAEYETCKSELLTAVTHELKTPLTSILGYTELLSAQETNDKHILERIKNSSVRVNDMINDMLKLLQITDMRFAENHDHPDQEESGQTNVDELVEELKEIYQHKKKNVVYAAGEGCSFPVAYTHLFSIACNLIDNAVKYSSSPLIEVSFRRGKSRCRMSVSDGGPLIPNDQRNRIFERFYVLSESRRKTGTGLGLAIVKHTAKLYGGEIIIRENERGGNTFTVLFPF